MEQTFALIKSDAIYRGETQAIMKALKEGGFNIVAARAMAAPCDPKMPEYAQYEALLAPHRDDPTYNAMLYSLTHPVGATMMVLEAADGAPGVVGRFLDFLGDSDPSKAAPGTLRQRFGTSLRDNAVHGSASPEEARREIAIGFPAAPPPLVSYALPSRLAAPASPPTALPPSALSPIDVTQIEEPANAGGHPVVDLMIESVVESVTESVAESVAESVVEVRAPALATSGGDRTPEPAASLADSKVDSGTTVAALPGWTGTAPPPPRRRLR